MEIVMTNQELLSLCNEYLEYNPDTGVFIWKKTKTNSVKRGDVAGCFDGNYTVIGINGRSIGAHRIAFLMHYKYLPKYIDHKNGVKTENWAMNLRDCTKQQNHFNIGPTSVNRSGYKGVGWRENRKKWRARIMKDQKEKSLGHFDCKHEAAKAYNKAAKELFGEFAWLNTIMADM